jgi:hypothetical protein
VKIAILNSVPGFKKQILSIEAIPWTNTKANTTLSMVSLGLPFADTLSKGYGY